MKKVMLFVVASLFSVAANAATINITNDVPNNNSILYGISPITDPAGATYAVLKKDFFNVHNKVITDTTGNYQVEWTFNPMASFTSGDISLGADSTVLGFVWPQAITGAYSYVINLIAGNNYYMDLQGYGDKGLNVTVTVSSLSSVPVPAALFLFAPALLGFFGLRRKATLAA